MKKKSISYKILSKKELQHLKEYYVEEKVKSMSHEELKEFVKENIDHQINQTIGEEEEREAWREMENFFSDSFDKLIDEIKKKYAVIQENNNSDKNEYEQRLEIIDQLKAEDEKKDMWED